MKYSIQHQFHIAANKNTVYDALTTINGLRNWWTILTDGDPKINGELQFNFGDYIGPKMKVTALVPNESVEWVCVDSKHGWQNHTFSFKLDIAEGKTAISFIHNGWDEQGEFYAHCNFSWGRYLESLRQYCQTGNGESHGSQGYRK